MGFFKFIDTIGSGIANGAKTVAKGTVSLGKGLGEAAESGVLITRSGIAAIGGDSKEASRLSKKAGSKIKSGGIGIATGAGDVVGGAVDGTLGSVVNGGVDVVGEIVRPIDADAANTIESPAVKAGVNIAVGVAVTVATAGGGGASLAEDAEALAKIAEGGGELAGEASDLIATTKKAEDAERLVQDAKEAESLAAKALDEAPAGATEDELAELEKNASDASKAVEEAEDSASEAKTMKDAAEEKINNSEKWEKWKNIAKKIFKTGNTLNTLERAKLLLCLASPTLPPLFTSSKYKNDADFRDMLSQLGGFIFTTSADGKFIVPSVKDETYTLKGTSEKESTSIEFEDTDSLLKDMVVSGDGIANGTRVSRVNEFTVDLNKPTVEKVDNNITFYSVVSKKVVSAGKDSPLLTLNDTKDLQKYMQIIGDGIPKGSRIMRIDGNKVTIGKGKLPTLSQSKTTKQLTNSDVQFRALVKQNMPDPNLDKDRIMSDLAWYDKTKKEFQREVQNPDQSILDKATVENSVPDRVFAMGDITRSPDGESTTFTINVINTQTGEKTPWSLPQEFVFGYYLFRSERDCLSSASDKAILKKANKIHEGKAHDVFNSKTRKTLKLIGMILLAILVIKMVSKSKTHPILKTAITLSIIAGVVFYHTPIQTMINRISSHKLAVAQQRVSSVKDKLLKGNSPSN